MPKKKKKSTFTVPPDAIDLATQIASNERALLLIKEDNTRLRKKLTETMMHLRIPHINVTLKLNKGQKVYYSLQLIDERGFVPVEKALRKFLKMKIRKWNKDSDSWSGDVLANHLSKQLAKYLRVDSFLVTKLRDKKWGQKLLESKTIKPYIKVDEGFINGDKQ